MAAKKAEQSAKDTFKSGGLGSDLPEIKVSFNEIVDGINFIDFLALNKITSSKSEARRAINNKGLKINNVLVVDEKKIIEKKDFNERILKISFGKKKHYIVKII